MFKLKILLVSFTIVILVCPLDVFARGGGGRGGGGGGRGGGGGGRSMSGGGGGSMSRSPSMSRPSPSQSRPSPSASRPSSSRPSAGGARTSTGALGSRPSGAAGARPGASAGARPATGAAGRPSAGNVAGSGRPSQGQLNSFLNVPSQGSRPGASVGSRPAGGNAAVSDFFHSGGGAVAVAGAGAGAVAGARAGQAGVRAEGARTAASGNRAGNRGDRQSARVESRGEHRSSLAEGRGERQTERQQQRGERADSIRDELGNQFDENHLFEDFWRDNPQAYLNFQQNPALWSWAAFSTVSAFMPWNWGTGNYYDYGSSGGSSSSGDAGTVYADEATYSSPEYCEEAEQLASSAPEEPPADTEWLSLGVFAAADEKSNSIPNMFLQLAVSKEGIIAGTYQNKTTGQTESLEGMVDQESQRVAWTVTGKNTPIMETGLQNLTMNETPALVHFADGTTQNWLLVRVAKPEDTQTGGQSTTPQ
ncbi:hypothetical protein [Bythopirellula goksoeyrii]|uniref:Uncharacterized protein n=1 Tax=Bythopirellula goksoeyrii TaxID=1400387 RepID=A0A5B9QKG5_9BACT|nr:hypothetical protein [Bythopirellula goksoeyrii]QEG37536.1 hypothetical protein Pr1d_48820 [Bythopirellula goksoeyrii]